MKIDNLKWEYEKGTAPPLGFRHMCCFKLLRYHLYDKHKDILSWNSFPAEYNQGVEFEDTFPIV